MSKTLGWRPTVGIVGFVLAAAAFLVSAQGAAAGVASGSLDCPSLTPGNPTHYDLQVGTTVTCTIDGASDVSGQTSVPVFIKSSILGNTTLTGTVSGSGASTLITFTYTAPSGGCFTTIVAYGRVGNNANNAVITPGGSSSAGFRFVDSTGAVIDICGPPTPPAVALTVSKTAIGSFSRQFSWGIEKSVDQTLVEQAGTSATFNYTVSVTHDAGTDSGWQVTGLITVLNPNSGDAVVTVTDKINDPTAICAVSGGVGATIPALSSVDFTYTCTGFVSPSGTETNTGTASWLQQTLTDGEALAAGSADGTATVDWSSVVPSLVDNCVSVSDTLGGLLGTVCSTDSSPKTFTYAHTVTGTPGTCVTQDNTATFTTNTTGTTGHDSKSVELCVGKDLSVTKTANPSFTRTFTWGIQKDVDKTQLDIAAGGSAKFTYTVSVTHDSGTDSGWQVSGVITITNPNNWEAITADVTDAVDNGGLCAVTGGTGVIVPASGSVDLNYTCTYGSAPSSTSGTNTAAATWDSAAFFTPTGSATGTAAFGFITPTTIVDGSVNVTDTLGGSLGTVSYTDPSPTTFTYSLTFIGDPAGTCTTHNNTATFVAASSATGSSSQTVTVCVGADLTVSKTANPSFTRRYVWSISKAVDKTRVEQVGGTATFTYTVTASETGFTDSGWQVSGVITVANPNDWEAITANVTDAVDNGGLCTVTGGTGVIVPKSSSVNLNYICTYASEPSPSSGTNTATAAWDKGAFSTPDGSAMGTAAFAFGAPTSTLNKTVTITDTFNGTTTTLGTLTATDSTPFASATFIYSRTVPVPAFNCVTYTNTAMIVETGQTASQRIQVCGPAKTGALTMGFWQNKNGQGIISGGSATLGVCNSGTWLRQFAPFQDLSATANCAGVATYAYNTIKAATCGGSTCNAMLKAQMLATALDVYFSDPSLGGNKIGAPAPIGGVAIDLTKICAMIDGSGGSTCTGSYENVSSAFGGATSMTVLQMLSFAAGQSNSGGSTWYANVKATQVLAKDAFDAINNQVAFSV